jgi:glycerophosphoryl diester phosphodiesterase
MRCAEMRQFFAFVLAVCTAGFMQAEVSSAVRTELWCHRTANKDLPENTLESLESAALMGCDVVEIDLRRTLDGRIVLNHDGFLERLTNGTGDVESTYFDDLRLRDVGSWMGERFSGMQIALFEDALRLARARQIRLILDLKTKGIGAEVLRLVRREEMLERVRFNGEWADVKELFPSANTRDAMQWVQPGITAAQVQEYHGRGKMVMANFSANHHEMDLDAMKAAVSAGVDGINVDYPRLGSEALGRPVELALRKLISEADSGKEEARAAAILELARFTGFPLQPYFLRWLSAPDNHISRAAAIALVEARPRTDPGRLQVAVRSENSAARANAAWAMGVLSAHTAQLTSMLNDAEPSVLSEVLMALSRVPGKVAANKLLPFLSHHDAAVRGAAALALAHHRPFVAEKAVPERLRVEVKAARVLYDEWVKRGMSPLSAGEIQTVTDLYRCQMKLLQAISMLKGKEATKALEAQAFRPGEDFAQMNAIVAGFQMWDRIAADPGPAIRALGSKDAGVADRAEWMLVQAGPGVLPEVLLALNNTRREVRERATRSCGLAA